MIRQPNGPTRYATSPSIRRAHRRSVCKRMVPQASLWVKGTKPAELKAITAAAGHLAQLKADRYLSERALEYTFGESILTQQNREQVGRLALEYLNVPAHRGADTTAHIDDGCQFIQ